MVDPMNASTMTRIETDLLGSRELMQDNYYGIQTLRAIENFNLTNSKVADFPIFIQALAMVKLACAEANFKLNKLPEAKFKAIEFACKALMQNEYHQYFKLDMLQGGAGTSTNMNANEVIANIALQFMQQEKGQYQFLHPNNDVNMSQSTNDVYPTAIRVALIKSLAQLKLPFQNLINSFSHKGQEFAHILKMGRTQLQDAVPMTLGQEFHAFAHTLQKDFDQLYALLPQTLASVNLGGTAIGTGINTDQNYRDFAVHALARISGNPIESASDLIEATSDMGDFVLLSGFLKRSATKLSKIANDLRLLSSGPRTGIHEIELEARQPGSSIMPGKVNPVIPEAMNMACFQIIANDLAISLAAEAGQLQLNAMEPLIAFKLFESIDLLAKAMTMLQTKCIDTIVANSTQCRDLLENSIGIITALNPYLGYETTTRIAKAALQQGQRIIDLVLAEQLLTQDQINDILAIENVIQPRKSA